MASYAHSFRNILSDKKRESLKRVYILYEKRNNNAFKNYALNLILYITYESLSKLFVASKIPEIKSIYSRSN